MPVCGESRSEVRGGRATGGLLDGLQQGARNARVERAGRRYGAWAQGESRRSYPHGGGAAAFVVFPAQKSVTERSPVVMRW
ncbi:MAG: hypothetical protein A2Y38_14045 [Spirochaetes bacterium GWB1_59_5]|nr:MAG: hypothetical protein A2Y38_14045 [Spirochaetes bacterium GWB1_59_5]